MIDIFFKEWNVSVISFEKDPEPIWKNRDDLVKNICKKHNIQVIERSTHTLYDPEEIYRLNGDSMPNTFEDFKNLCLRIGQPEKPVPSIDLQFISSRLLKTANIYNKEIHQVPGLEFFSKKKECDEQEICLFEGGETKALELSRKRLEYEVELFNNGQTNPNLSKPDIFSSKVSLSPYFRFGCLSVRRFYWEIKLSYEKVK